MITSPFSAIHKNLMTSYCLISWYRQDLQPHKQYWLTWLKTAKLAIPSPPPMGVVVVHLHNSRLWDNRKGTILWNPCEGGSRGGQWDEEIKLVSGKRGSDNVPYLLPLLPWGQTFFLYITWFRQKVRCSVTWDDSILLRLTTPPPPLQFWLPHWARGCGFLRPWVLGLQAENKGSLDLIFYNNREGHPSQERLGWASFDKSSHPFWCGFLLLLWCSPLRRRRRHLLPLLLLVKWAQQNPPT